MSNSPRVGQLVQSNVTLSFVFNVQLLTLLLSFCPTSWVILKQLDPSPSRATGLDGLIAHSASPLGLLTAWATGLIHK